jgi:hypothetical protein
MPREAPSRKEKQPFRGLILVFIEVSEITGHGRFCGIITVKFPSVYESFFMKTTKKQWIKPALKSLPIFFECTCYAGAV